MIHCTGSLASSPLLSQNLQHTLTFTTALTLGEAFEITVHLESGTIWVAMVKFHYRNVCVCIRQPAETFARSQIKQGSMEVPLALTTILPSNYQSMSSLTHRALLSASPKCHPFIPASTVQRKKGKTTCNENMQMKRPPQKR